LEVLGARYPNRLRSEEVGKSFMGRPVHLLKIGTGPQKILLWSQMHGDEPSATPALLDIVDFLLSRLDDAVASQVLESFTLLMIPMLNPDGAEVYDRRNAQGIDINRDALNLATPEGRILKRVRDEHKPILGFNLHDQNRRTTVGDTGVLATNAVLAVAGDPQGTLTPGRLRAKRACSAIAAALAPFVPGGMARYDEDWSPRAFGDNLTAWGTPVVLIESGGLPENLGFGDLSRLNFVAILTVLKDLARNDLADYAPDLYEGLERNQRNAWVDVAVRGGDLLLPGAQKAFRADVIFNRVRQDRYDAGCEDVEPVAGSRIEEIGDARFVTAGRDISSEGSTLVAPFEVGIRGWAASKWLTEASLGHLAQFGVGKILWSVEDESTTAAQEWGKTLQGPGQPILRIVSASSELPWLQLEEIPSVTGDRRLGSRLKLLLDAGEEVDGSHRETREILDKLWSTDTNRRPALRVGEPASFVLLRVENGEEVDLANALVESIWLDGELVELTSN
jgi:hypothetical protein